jgi:hypothetical protein
MYRRFGGPAASMIYRDDESYSASQPKDSNTYLCVVVVAIRMHSLPRLRPYKGSLVGVISLLAAFLTMLLLSGIEGL